MPKMAYSRFTSFNTQPPEGGWAKLERTLLQFRRFNTQPPEGGWVGLAGGAVAESDVSTHSRPKAAGFGLAEESALHIGFNTQPPEGGWKNISKYALKGACFNTQPPEGGWRSG